MSHIRQDHLFPTDVPLDTLGCAQGSNKEIIKPFSLQSFLTFVYHIPVPCDNTWLEPKYTVLTESSQMGYQGKIGFTSRCLMGTPVSVLGLKAANFCLV